VTIRQVGKVVFRDARLPVALSRNPRARWHALFWAADEYRRRGERIEKEQQLGARGFPSQCSPFSCAARNPRARRRALFWAAVEYQRRGERVERRSDNQARARVAADF
jgi:hypothetical protein